MFAMLSVGLTLACDAPSPVESRRFPYPYEAALAICSDIDETTPEEFVAMQRWLCTADTTDLGPGLGLEIGNSFWMYNQYLGMLAAPGSNRDSVAALFIGWPDSGLSWFAGTSDSLSSSAPLIAALARAGYLDCLHTYGHFNDTGFTRELAVAGIAALREDSIRVTVFVNHNSPQNSHNLGPDPSERGDDRDAPEYHADLTVGGLGARFLWRGRLTHCVGQSGDPSVMNLLKSAYEWAASRLHATGPGFAFGNDLVHPLRLDDGRWVHEFTRFTSPWGRTHAAGAAALAHQLAPGVLDDLVANRGTMIVYTHLGRNAGPPYIPEQTVAALRDLQRRHEAGEIFVTTTSRLLRYHVNQRSLFRHTERRGDTLVIVIDSLANEVDGRWLPDAADLMGMTFYVPTDTPARCTIAGHPVPIIRNPLDRSGRESVSIPWRPLVWPAGR